MNTNGKTPELLCPAGSMQALQTALHFGADAVYGGMKRFGLRAFAGNFDQEQLRQAVAMCHEKGKKFYLTMNVFPFDDQLEDFVAAAQTAHEIGVDAAIVSDLGAIVTLRERVPGLTLHVSTQASTVNSPAVKHYRELGCERVILARETSIARMAAIHEAVPEMEIETFVHGASCVAWSGRCLLSAALTGRSGNQGECAQPCRWQYAVMEQKRPGEYLPVSEDENGTYIFSAKDLNLMPLLPELVKAGVASLKIEGRMKTEYYVAVVTGAYRRALDLLKQGVFPGCDPLFRHSFCTFFSAAVSPTMTIISPSRTTWLAAGDTVIFSSWRMAMIFTPNLARTCNSIRLLSTQLAGAGTSTMPWSSESSI